MTENDDDKKEEDNKPDKKSFNKKLTPKNNSVKFTNVNNTDEENNEEVCASQYSFAFNTHISTSDNLRHLLLLENQSTCDIFCNPKLLKNIHSTPNSMSVKGNGGSITTNKIGYLKNYGKVWFDERAITNILYLKNVKHKYQVTYDSSTDGVFTVHTPGQQLHFVMQKESLHYHDTRNREITLVQMVQENVEGYSQRQIQDAKKGSRPLCEGRIPVSERLQKYHYQEPHFELSCDRK